MLTRRQIDEARARLGLSLARVAKRARVPPGALRRARGDAVVELPRPVLAMLRRLVSDAEGRASVHDQTHEDPH